ncbi:MAG: hypothetical protein ABII22_02710 [Candidatus Micrarchaeota archaeon]
MDNKSVFSLGLLLMLLLSGCTQNIFDQVPPFSQPPPVSQQPPVSDNKVGGNDVGNGNDVSHFFCGDGTCNEGKETIENCPSDCKLCDLLVKEYGRGPTSSQSMRDMINGEYKELDAQVNKYAPGMDWLPLKFEENKGKRVTWVGVVRTISNNENDFVVVFNTGGRTYSAKVMPKDDYDVCMTSFIHHKSTNEMIWKNDVVLVSGRLSGVNTFGTIYLDDVTALRLFDGDTSRISGVK